MSDSRERPRTRRLVDTFAFANLAPDAASADPAGSGHASIPRSR